MTYLPEEEYEERELEKFKLLIEDQRRDFLSSVNDLKLLDE